MSTTLFPYDLRKGDTGSTSFPYVANESVSTDATMFPFRNTPKSNIVVSSYPYIFFIKLF